MKKLISVIVLLAMITSVAVFPTVVNGTKTDEPSETYVHQDAQYEDSDISLWFEHSTEKVKSTDTTSTGKESYTVYMAKNEIENAQFVLASSADKSGLTVELSGFVDEKGNCLKAEICVEMYQDCDNYGNIPDAIPTMDEYGAFSLTAGTSQAFLIKIYSYSDTVSGLYSSTLSICDKDKKEIKKTKVFAYVWNFELSEKTECGTSINLGLSYLRSFYGTDADLEAIYKNYYDYLLENRVSSYYLPGDITESSITAYMDNPRVTSFQMKQFSETELSNAQTKIVYKMLSADENRFNKAYYFSGVVDASKPADLELLRQKYNELYTKNSSLQPSFADKPFWFINTYINDIDYNNGTETIDQIEYYKDFVNFWCSKTFAYTDESELSTQGAKLLQPTKWNSVYGTFKDRMAAKRAAGQKVWWFISWDVDAPYINYFIQTDGVAQRILFWQQYDNGVQGFLYNFSNFWYVSGGDPYTANLTNTSMPNAHGESILVYPGTKFGKDTPVGSLRLEAMRDGIEDYQMFSMLESLCGEGAADEIIDTMTTGMVTYSVSDDSYKEARIALGEAVEKAVKMSNCDHEYTSAVTTEETCTEPGIRTYTCEKCGKTYTEEIPAGHNFVKGKCTRCSEVQFILGDLDGDTKITAIDVNIIKRIVSAKLPPSLAGDLNGDTKVTAADANLLKKVITGK